MWQYEHIRQFILELNLLVVQLLGVCTRDKCEKMTARKDYMFLCANHADNEKCSAIDYMIHALDNATAMIHNSSTFSSRIAIPQSSQSNL